MTCGGRAFMLLRPGRVALARIPDPAVVVKSNFPPINLAAFSVQEEEEEEEEGFFNHYKNVLKRHAHTPSGVAGADPKSQSGGALRTPTLSRFSPPMTCTIPYPT